MNSEDGDDISIVSGNNSSSGSNNLNLSNEMHTLEVASLSSSTKGS